MTGKNPQQTGKNPPIHREFAGNTTDHSNYGTDLDRDIHEKNSIIERKKSIYPQQLSTTAMSGPSGYQLAIWTREGNTILYQTLNSNNTVRICILELNNIYGKCSGKGRSGWSFGVEFFARLHALNANNTVRICILELNNNYD